MTRTALLALLGLLSAFGALLAISTACRTVASGPVPPLDLPQRHGPWSRRVAATGIVAADGDDLHIGIPEPGIIQDVAVVEGQVVDAGDVLLRIDDRLARSELAIAEAAAAHARAAVLEAQAACAKADAVIQRLASLPRAEDALPAAARVAVAEAQLASARIQRARIEELYRKQAASADQVDARRSAENIAVAQARSARSDLEHARLPAWEPELAVARAEAGQAGARARAAEAGLAEAEAHCEAAKLRLARHVVRSPAPATVVSLTACAGAQAASGDRGLIVLADLRRLRVTVDVDEAQAWKVVPGSPGAGWVRGDRSRTLALAFLRAKPLARARQSILGVPGERIDARSVQLEYIIQDPPAYLRPGLMLEVDLPARDEPAPPPSAEGQPHAPK